MKKTRYVLLITSLETKKINCAYKWSATITVAFFIRNEQGDMTDHFTREYTAFGDTKIVAAVDVANVAHIKAQEHIAFFSREESAAV
jgi:hypothetical protein